MKKPASSEGVIRNGAGLKPRKKTEKYAWQFRFLEDRTDEIIFCNEGSSFVQTLVLTQSPERE